MKLKPGFLLHEVNGEYIVVATGEASKSFNGLVRNNETSAFIFKELMEETTIDKIVDRMLEEYNAPREVIEKDVNRIVETIRNAGFLDE